MRSVRKGGAVSSYAGGMSMHNNRDRVMASGLRLTLSTLAEPTGDIAQRLGACLYSVLAPDKLDNAPRHPAYAAAAASAYRTAALVLAWKARHGAFPGNLASAVSPMPADPFNGSPLRYRRERGGFVVYSVGPDGKFDGGTPGGRPPRSASLFRWPQRTTHRSNAAVNKPHYPRTESPPALYKSTARAGAVPPCAADATCSRACRPARPAALLGGERMAQQTEHQHVHSATCGHTRILHEGHMDYLHDGQLHSENAGAYEEHRITVSSTNPDQCKPVACECGHDGCGHEMVPHGNHQDYLVNGRLHRRHGDHCDDHGPVSVQH